MAKEIVNLENPVEEEEIFARCTSDRGLVFRRTLTNNFYKMKLEKPHKQTTQLKVSYGIDLKTSQPGTRITPLRVLAVVDT